jgi:integrase
MPKIAKEVSALVVARITAEGDHQVGGVPGLLLRVIGNSRVWVLRIRVEGVRRSVGLGPYPTVSLAQARDKARERRQAVADGLMTWVSRDDARTITRKATAKGVLFRDAAQAMIKAKAPEWSNPKHAAQWRSTLETYAYPLLGDVAVTDIDTALILDVLKTIWYSKPETASRVRGRVESVIDYACVLHTIKMDNPARWKGNLDVLLPAKAKVRAVKHHRAVPWQAAPAAFAQIAAADGIAAKALTLIILTAARSQEVLGMRWREVDKDAALWRVPVESMKAKRPHVVPLSRQAMALLDGLTGGPDELVFPSPRDGVALSDSATCAVMDRLKISATTHGWRSTFRDWGAESTSHPNELLEMALAHAVANKAEAAYRRGDMIERRRPLMQDWADFVAGSASLLM